jgi:hypothetical protein
MKVGIYKVKWCYPTNDKEKTVCFIDNDDLPFFNGYGQCFCSKKDMFDRNKARKLSLLRALQDAGMSKEERIPFWEAYRTMTEVPRWGR